MKQIIYLALVALMPIMLTSCGVTELVLLPRPDAEDRTDAEAFCNRDGNNLIVRVSNVGPKDAAPTKVTVDYFDFGTQTVTTPTIPGQGIIEVTVPIPAGCFNSDCNYKITLDPDNNVEEPREDNNSQDGNCIG